MKKQIIITLTLMLVFLTGEIFAGNNALSSKKIMSQPYDSVSMKTKSGMKMNMSMVKTKKNTSSKVATTSKLIRTGVINVEALDKNKDGKLYEDVMDFNVISDKPGICPICGMKLHEMTIRQVKQNLKNHGFKYK